MRQIGIRIVVVFFLLLGLKALSDATFGNPFPAGELRLNARLTQARMKHCRAYTEAELASIPLHMRNAEKCETVMIPYHVRWSLLKDGEERVLLDSAARHSGRKEDRPIVIYREEELMPGTYRTTVSLLPEDDSLKSHQWEGDVTIAADRVTLLSLDEKTGDFTVRSSGSRL